MADALTYQMLSRLIADCDYYLGAGNYYAGHLWAGDEQAHIDEIHKLYNSLPEDEKPTWLTPADISYYERGLGCFPSVELEPFFDGASNKTAGIWSDISDWFIGIWNNFIDTMSALVSRFSRDTDDVLDALDDFDYLLSGVTAKMSSMRRRAQGDIDPELQARIINVRQLQEQIAQLRDELSNIVEGDDGLDAMLIQMGEGAYMVEEKLVKVSSKISIAKATPEYKPAYQLILEKLREFDEKTAETMHEATLETAEFMRAKRQELNDNNPSWTVKY